MSVLWCLDEGRRPAPSAALIATRDTAGTAAVVVAGKARSGSHPDRD